MTKKVCFTLINKCNWNCDYCIAGTRRSQNKSQPKIDLKKKIQDLSKFQNVSISLTGGEPGLLSQPEWEEILMNISDSNEIHIMTNGLFFDRLDLSATLKNKITSISWHFIENLNILEHWLFSFRTISRPAFKKKFQEQFSKIKNIKITKNQKRIGLDEFLELHFVYTVYDIPILKHQCFKIFLEDIKELIEPYNLKIIPVPDINSSPKEKIELLKTKKLLSGYKELTIEDQFFENLLKPEIIYK